MPQVPKTGTYYLSGDTNGIKESIEAAPLGGTPISTDIVGLRDAAEFEQFDTDFLDGATDLSGITNSDQFRGYPSSNFDLISVVCTSGFNTPAFWSWQSWVTIHLVSNDSQIGAITATRDSNSNSNFSNTWGTGTSTKAAFQSTATSPQGVSSLLFLNPSLIISSHGAFYIKIKVVCNGNDGITDIMIPGLLIIGTGNYYNCVNYYNGDSFASDSPGINGAKFVNSGNSYPNCQCHPQFTRSWAGLTGWVIVTFDEYY